MDDSPWMPPTPGSPPPDPIAAVPPAAPGREVVRLRGNHSLRSDMPGLRAAVRDFLTG